MTDSNINNLLDNNKKEENTNEQPVDTNFDSQIVDSGFTNVFKELIIHLRLILMIM